MSDDWMRPEDWQKFEARRLEQARETLEAAHLVADAGHWRTGVNRLYHACFYAAEARLASPTLRENAQGVRMLFNKHFVKTDWFRADLADFYNTLFEQRMKSDYEAFAEIAPDEVRAWLPQAESFVEAVATQIDADASDT